jgi:hypothetical protein
MAQKNNEIPSEKNEDTKKKILTLFLIFFPSVIISIIPAQINGSLITSFGIKICLLLLQFVALKNFVDIHYE